MTTPTTVQARFQLRADTAANWTSVNPVLLNNEFGLETDTKKLKVGNGSTAWNSLAYFPTIVSGGTVLGNLEIGTTGTLTFEGSTADGFETTLAVANPTADRTITLPNQSGNVIVSGNASIVNADISASAEIAVSKLADGAARQLLQTDAAGTGVEWTDNVDIPGTLDVTGAATFDAAVTIAGDLTVNGTTTNINTQNLVVEDKNIIIGDVATPTDVTADGGGITLKGATDKTINWVDATDAWTSSERFSIPAGTAGAPSLTITGDENTGIYSPSANQLGFSTDGTGRMLITQDGRVLVGSFAVADLSDGAGSSFTPSIFSTTTSGTAGIGVYVEDGTNNRRAGLFVDQTNGVWGLTGKWSSGQPDFVIRSGGSERARIDSSGRLLVGTSTSLGLGYQLQIAGVNDATSSLSLHRYQANASASLLEFRKSRGASVGTDAIVSSGDNLAGITARGYDGSSYIVAARIDATVDGTPGTNDMPGRIVLSTTADGASSPTERLRIDSAGRLRHFGDTIISNVNLANATYDSVSFSVAGQEVNPSGLFFSPDGRKMFVTGNAGDDITEYTLSTPWVVSSASHVTQFSVASQDTAPLDLYLRNDGKKLYVIGEVNDTVYQYTLSTPWSIASASYDSVSFSVTAQEIAPAGLSFKPDGLAFYIIGTNTDTIYRYNLSTAWDVSTATFANSFGVAGQETLPQSICFTLDGSRLFVLGNTGDDVTIYNLATPWDITTAVHSTQFSISAQEGTPNGLFVKPDGTKFYIVGSTNDTVYQYSIPSATIDLTGTTAINGSAEVAQDLTVRGGVGFYGTAAIAQPAGTGETTGFTAGTGTAVNDASTFTGNLGTTAYRINDVVKALKQLGLLAL